MLIDGKERYALDPKPPQDPYSSSVSSLSIAASSKCASLSRDSEHVSSSCRLESVLLSHGLGPSLVPPIPTSLDASACMLSKVAWKAPERWPSMLGTSFHGFDEQVTYTFVRVICFRGCREYRVVHCRSFGLVATLCTTRVPPSVTTTTISPTPIPMSIAVTAVACGPKRVTELSLLVLLECPEEVCPMVSCGL